ncbi:helix-turn-helix transcriptional regulator [Algicola sagamiensis]|uniref:helix-turn-helix transcriptional regulator n=1 Tax=Algicola sagamiensis TaxID=163869 RepID=UPI0003782AAE|nr:helix-turn-helix domain-containing protein [Algicola sagamiensis]
MDYPVIHHSYEIGSYQQIKPPAKKKAPELSLIECRFYTTREVLDILGITAPTLYKWQDEKGFPRPKIQSNPNRFLKAEVESWIQVNTTQNVIIDLN